MAVYVKVPAPIMLFEPHIVDGKPARKPAREMTFFEVIDWLTNDNYFAKPKMARVAQELLAEFESAKPGDIVKLTSEQHGHIEAVLENPSAFFNPIVSKQIVSYFDALFDPLTEDQHKKEQANGRSDARLPADA